SRPLLHAGAISMVNFSRDGRRIVTASDDQTARVWDALTGQPVTEPLKTDGTVFAAAFARDGNWVVTASSDRSARLWDVEPPSGPPPAWLPGFVEAVAGARFNEDGGIEKLAPEQFLTLKIGIVR